MKTICIYHGNCADGFASAWVVYKVYKEVHLLSEIEFHPGVYQQPPPDIVGKRVLMVDFSYPRPVMEKIINDAQRVTVLDHHKSAMEDLTPLIGDKAEIIFDMSKSGCRMTWDYYYPGEPPPELLLYIEDRDLWKFELHASRDINANVFSYPYDFKVWDKLMTTSIGHLIDGGNAIERKHFKDMNELLGVVQRRMNIGGYNVPIANLPYTFVSDAAHLMAIGERFAGCYWDTPDGRVFGLRSRPNDGIDVSAIAKQYGGGGHQYASGFKVSYAKAAEFEIDYVDYSKPFSNLAKGIE